MQTAQKGGVILDNLPRIIQALWLLVRISIIWLAFHGMGTFAHKYIIRSRINSSIPKLVVGILAYILLTFLLSQLNMLTRGILPFLVIIPAIYGALIIHRTASFDFLKSELPYWITVPAAALLLVLLLSSIFHSVLPHGMVDPLITYAVQPDRWLDAGGMYFLSETEFSFFPLLGEMLAVWPASLSAGRMDQLSMLQLFQMSLLTGSFIVAAKVAGLKAAGYLLALIVCLSSPILVKWGSWAKIDMTVLFLITAALAEIFKKWLICDDKRISMLTWFLLGLSVATKLTAVFVLCAILPFLLTSIRWKDGWRNYYLPGFILMMIVPLIFALRNYFITGEPFYPSHFPGFSTVERWTFEYVPCLYAVRSYGNASIIVNMFWLFKSWGFPGLLFLAGCVYETAGKRRKVISLLISVMIYAVISCILFDPVEWGAKYAILFLPVMAVSGLYFLRDRMKIVFIVLLPLIMITSSIIGRIEFICRFAANPDTLEFEGNDYPPALPLQLWMNENLPDGSRILSMWRPERYFSDHVIIVAQNHPDGIELFLDNSLEDELEILDRMDVQYIYFLMDDPLPENLEEHVELFDAIGPDERISPVITISGSLLCEYRD